MGVSDRRYFIAIDGKCKDCGYPVICEAGTIVDEVADKNCKLNGGDFHLYCSNPECINAKGVVCDDTQIDDNVPFIEFDDSFKLLKDLDKYYHKDIIEKYLKIIY